MANIAFPSTDRLKIRTAHPYRDLDVIDARAPRFNQVVVGTVSLLAVVTGWWPLLALLALQLGVGLRFGRQYCLPCLAYFELIQPRFGEGELEDSRPPRFANKVGFVFLSAASVAYLSRLRAGRRSAGADRGVAGAARRGHGLLHGLLDVQDGRAVPGSPHPPHRPSQLLRRVLDRR